MRRRGVVALFVLGWFSVGPGAVVAAAQCDDNTDCGRLQYCQKSTDDCDRVGVCSERPSVRPNVWDPVCGCNELTFDNAWFAAMEGITVFASGVCGPCPFDASTDCVFSDALESGGATRWSGIVGN
jgi:hypothetical protein